MAHRGGIQVEHRGHTGHMGQKIAATINVLLYLFKYLYKGPHVVRYSIQAADGNDEIASYQNARYISAISSYLIFLSYLIL